MKNTRQVWTTKEGRDGYIIFEKDDLLALRRLLKEERDGCLVVNLRFEDERFNSNDGARQVNLNLG